MRTSELLDWLEGATLLYEEQAINPEIPIDPKRIDLQKEYAKLNAKLFDGKLGMYPMKWNRRKGAGALVKWRKVGGEAKLVPPSGRRKRWRRERTGGVIKILSVEVSTFYQSTLLGFLSRLAHEMIHVFLLEQNIDDGHGKLFRAEMRRINAMNLGFEVKVSEKVTDFEVEGLKQKKGQRRGVIIMDGDKGILVFGPKHFSDTLFELIGFPQRFLDQHTFEWYWSDAGLLMQYPSKRKIGRSFGTYRATPEDVKEIRKGEKIAEMVRGEPKTLMPKYFEGATIVGMHRIGGRR
jgi:hypothetical protein